MDNNAIKKVHVVFKTHLDIGFTGMGETVLRKYREEYIPKSVELASRLNTETDKKFIWTVGAFLIKDSLENATEEAAENLRKAIKRGDICWHGLAFTTHTELLDEELADHDLSLSDDLDGEFGKHTIAAKMTDVPGHTRALVRAMARHGKKYLHIGVNPSSMVPRVPDTFLWKSGDDEIIVQYSYVYGAPCYVEGMDEVLEFAHTGDNLGPQEPGVIRSEMERIAKLYPNAKIIASTMDEYAAALLREKDRLPVIEEEIGDTWIHGIASDPLKISRYRELIRLKDIWRKEGRVDTASKEYKDFLTYLLLVAEHTWGLDYKKFLMDFTNWEKEDFNRARANDRTDLEMITNRNANMRGVLLSDIAKYRNGDTTGSYSFYESSHKEQMGYIFKAVEALPEDLKKEAAAAIEALDETDPAFSDEHKGTALSPYEHIRIGNYEVAFGGSGEIVYLSKNGAKRITDGVFGRLGYTTYNARDCADNYYAYNRDFRMNQCWSEGDFSKPGLEFVEGLEHRDYEFGLRSAYVMGNTVYLKVFGNERACEKYGCPRNGLIRYEFTEDSIKCRLRLTEKDANRMPEAIWFDMRFDVENPYRWRMKKIGEPVDPMDVLMGGNRMQHCTEEMDYAGADGKIRVVNIHAPLISVGGRALYGDCKDIRDAGKGFSYCLFNNKWGTNFKMWCEDDMTFDFEIEM
ncbi:MAG: DUF5054 domain-containing protein [Lachnospiraceae bacterium]|nr:DUF5054 domain-containing protein [Lachnospiraceae bacterium]